MSRESLVFAGYRIYTVTVHRKRRLNIHRCISRTVNVSIASLRIKKLEVQRHIEDWKSPERCICALFMSDFWSSDKDEYQSVAAPCIQPRCQHARPIPRQNEHPRPQLLAWTRTTLAGSHVRAKNQGNSHSATHRFTVLISHKCACCMNSGSSVKFARLP